MVLHEAIGRAGEAGDQATAATAHRELGFVEVQAGRRQTAEAWLAEAEALAAGDEQFAAIGGGPEAPGALSRRTTEVPTGGAAPATRRPGRPAALVPAGIIGDLDQRRLGRDATLVTVRWTCRRPDGSTIWEFLDSYLLAGEQGRWRILGDVVHE